MSAWAGFWIGCGLVAVGFGLGVIGDCVETGLRVLAKAYEDSCCDCDDDNNEEPDDV